MITINPEVVSYVHVTMDSVQWQQWRRKLTPDSTWEILYDDVWKEIYNPPSLEPLFQDLLATATVINLETFKIPVL
jgi:hypothetical protein